MSEALIAPTILVWARQRANVSLESLAKTLKIKAEKIQAWEQGALKPTFLQAQKLAKIFQIPFGYLFLQTPPKEELAIPDLRTFNNETVSEFSPEFKTQLHNITLKQKWYKDYILENDKEPKSFLQKFTINDSKELIAKDIFQILNLEHFIAKSLPKKKFLGLLIEEVEKLDILVMKSGIVGSNTHKSLNIDEFRGFAIYDKYAPLIFINTNDSLAGQIFTLLHELVHLWIGESGISLLDFQHIDNRIELFCNEITANLLVPQALLAKLWDPNIELEEHYTYLAKVFSVSTQVILNRLYALKYINFDAYKLYLEIEKEKFLAAQEYIKKTPGGDFYKTLRSKNGTNFSYALIISTLEGKTLYKEAATLLNTSAANINKFAKELSIL